MFWTGPFSGDMLISGGRICDLVFQLSHEKYPALLSIESWLVNRDP